MYAPLTYTRPGPQKGVSKATITGFRRAKSLKEILVRAKVPPVKKNRGFLRLCKKLRRETYLLKRDNSKCSPRN